MEGLFDFAQDIGLALSWVLPLLCYVGGTWFLVGGLLGILQRSAAQNGLLAKPFVPELMIAVGATFLSFPEFLNVGNRTLGFAANVDLGASQKLSFSTDTLSNAAKGGPLQTLTAILTVWHTYFACYGALIVYFAFVRQVGRAKGTNNSSPALNAVMGISGFFVMNADVIAPALLKELKLGS
ncbi:hypothetical protein [Gluconacetobacter dulcium]|uniref:hypothetical protein n=1 Tax=Gluconacetobacter dulcium TaxID=2729096 RepID=UPI002180BEE4|nr:hypothetical protein [Gluconacetobacter dulcium]